MTTAPELVADLGITYRQLDYWERCGYIRSIPRTEPKSGYPREFTSEECAIARSIRDLLEAGFTIQGALRIIRHLQDNPGDTSIDLADGVTLTIDRNRP